MILTVEICEERRNLFLMICIFQSSEPASPVRQGLREIDADNVVMGRELGQGEFGSVLMGVWTNPEGKKVSYELLHGFN